MSDAVITGTFADFKLIKTRSTVQVIIECPIEHAKDVTDLLGFPQPGREIHVAVARLGSGYTKKVDHTLSRQAAMCCDDPIFRKFLEENYQHIGPVNDPNDPDNHQAPDVLREITGVDSRSEYDTDPAAGQRWRSLHDRFIAWRQV